MSKSAPSSSGAIAESQAADFLLKQKFKILDRNWKNRWCEIDIVAEKRGIIHFVEVKFRKTSFYGSGFDYIGSDKQSRLKRAAEMWMLAHRRAGDYQIDAISITGQAIEYLPNAVEG